MLSLLLIEITNFDLLVDEGTSRSRARSREAAPKWNESNMKQLRDLPDLCMRVWLPILASESHVSHMPIDGVNRGSLTPEVPQEHISLRSLVRCSPCKQFTTPWGLLWTVGNLRNIC